MENFTISRINTNSGIFRLSGKVINENGQQRISYDVVEVMGTDGWCQLDLGSADTQSILNGVESEVLIHLSP